jgi:hypothetical protein
LIGLTTAWLPPVSMHPEALCIGSVLLSLST